MSQTFSTLHQEMVSGRVYSSRTGLVTVLAPPGQAGATAPVRRPAGPPAPTRRGTVSAPTGSQVPTGVGYQYILTGQGLPFPVQAGITAGGAVQVRSVTPDSCEVDAWLQGLRAPSDPAVVPVLWLIHDLLVPSDLAPADLAALPKGASGTGNVPGSIYTLDGNPPAYGSSTNTLTVAVRPGSFEHLGDGAWHLNSRLDATNNRAFHPLVILGPEALADLDAALPSGVAGQVLTDLFMCPATVHPELTLFSHFAQRVQAIAGKLTQTAARPAVSPAEFGRAAVTMEGPLRGTPFLMPTRDSCVLVSLSRTAF